MIAVIFEVKVRKGKTTEYLDIANEIKHLLSEMDGFISIERFQSVTNENKMLSLSFWKDEESVKKWRNPEAHRIAQKKAETESLKTIDCELPALSGTTE